MGERDDYFSAVFGQSKIIMTKENFKKAYIESVDQLLPIMSQDNSGRWFVAKKSLKGIEFEIMEDEEAARNRLSKLLFNPNSNNKTK